jgi:hypothetical protein
VAAVLGMAMFAVILPKMAPFTLGAVGAFGATAVVMALFVLTRGKFATALKSILAFWLIIMTYVGVNFVLGIGLHSYGFGTGAVVTYLFLIGGCDLALVAVCCVLHLVRRGIAFPPAPGPPATAAA